jgi:hypothetical protein
MKVEIKVLGPLGQQALSTATLEMDVDEAIEVQRSRGLSVASWVRTCAQRDLETIRSGRREG